VRVALRRARNGQPREPRGHHQALSALAMSGYRGAPFALPLPLPPTSPPPPQCRDTSVLPSGGPLYSTHSPFPPPTLILYSPNFPPPFTHAPSPLLIPPTTLQPSPSLTLPPLLYKPPYHLPLFPLFLKFPLLPSPSSRVHPLATSLSPSLMHSTFISVSGPDRSTQGQAGLSRRDVFEVGDFQLSQRRYGAASRSGYWFSAKIRLRV